MKKGLLVIGFISLSLILVGLRRNSAPFFSVKNYHCNQPRCISDDYYSAINTRIEQLLQDNISARNIIAQISKDFPIINKIIVSYNPTAVQIKISAQEPLCCINDSLVLTQQQELFAKNSFSHDALCHIPSITVAQEKVASVLQQVCSLLHSLPAHFDQMYDLELLNEHCVYLRAKQGRNFTIVSSVTDQKIPQLLAQCELVKNNINQRKGFDKGISWVADTRFSDYIVAYKI